MGDDTWRRAGWAGAAIGVLAAGAAAGVAIERLALGRSVREKARLALDSEGPYGTLRGTPGRVFADDGTELFYEVDEVDEVDEAEGVGGAAGVGAGERARRLFGGEPPAALTVVFCHGYCLAADSWHFQRAALRGAVRAVYWDQRSHGRSGRGAAQTGPDGVPVSIDQLGRDLKAVLDAAAPEGPLVLVGHSMGGMTVMALADRFPELVRERVVGVALVGTSAGQLDDVSYGLPPAGVKAVRRVLPGVLRVLGTRVELVERGRRATTDLFAGLVKKYSFATKDIDPAVARFAERMIESTPIDVVAEFYPAFAEHEKTASLAAFRDLPVLALAGDQDLVTPPSHTEAIARALPDAELVVLPDAGHLVMLERPEEVTGRLADLLVRAGETVRARGRK
ncbi:alpha/beta hydrolase [Streptomyces sp. NPDC048717]|uniref:alpha/beta fold hydrolase n=1 Tax=Streptomyces sp. NPDC048717 TaxID=3154928 RepID=UPI00343F6641